MQHDHHHSGRASGSGAPTLRELVSDPLVRLVMKSDGITPCDVWAAVTRGRGGGPARETAL